jgi:phage tail sheath gpL-like
MGISNAIAPSAVARVVGVKTTFKNLQGGILLLPQRIAVIGQGATAGTFLLDKKQVFSSFEVGLTFGFGSPLHLSSQQLFPQNNDGVGSIPVTLYPITDGTTAATGDSIPSGTQTETKTYTVLVNEIPSELIVIPKDTTAIASIALFITAINANVDMPVIASDGTTKVDFTAKWKGESGNDLFIDIIGESAGITFVINQPSGGAGNPDVQPALDNIANTWETLLLNCLNIEDTTNLDVYESFGEGRWLPIEPKPLIVFTGNNEADPVTAVTVSDARKNDRVNNQLVAPASKNLPLVIAARELARIVVIANSNPPTEYAGQFATGLVPGNDIDQWTGPQREFAVKAGSSTIEVTDGVIELSDTITFFHPTGDPLPAYRYVVDIVKIANVVFNVRLIFESSEWKGKVLIPDGQATTNPNARRPSTAKAALAKMIDSLALAAIISDPKTAKKTLVAAINPTNPKRLDISFTYQLSGNTNIISIDANWGFFFGAVTPIAA